MQLLVHVLYSTTLLIAPTFTGGKGNLTFRTPGVDSEGE